MKKTVHWLLAGWVLSAIVLHPFPDSSPGFSLSSSWTVQATPALVFVTGTVKDLAGAPLGGATVSLLEPQIRGKEIKSIKTDATGKFSTGMPPGTYRIRALAEGFLPILSPRLIVERPTLVYNIALKRDDTLIQQRGDAENYRWVGMSVPRHVLNFDEDKYSDPSKVTITQNSFAKNRPQFRGMVQVLGMTGTLGSQQSFYGTNVAISAALGNVEMAVIGQRGFGDAAPQRISAYATMRPRDNHQVTASVGYGQAMLPNTYEAPLASPTSRNIQRHARQSLDQVSVSAVDEWQVFQPLLVIYGFDYSRFTSSNAAQADSLLPRIALQYTPNAQWRVNAAYTPGSTQNRRSLESFNTENLDATFETQAADTALLGTSQLDRSRRIELGVERMFAEGKASLETSAFYDIVSGHGVGVLALPLEASPDAQAAMQQVATQVAAMNGAARGMRLMTARHVNEYVTVSVGYSAGFGSRFGATPLTRLTPARVFSQGFFQVAAAKLDLDFTRRTGTRVSTVVRLSPSAVVFAIDPFAGRMGIYDPNINVYVTQQLPNFGFPIRWEALVDLRNLLNQMQSADDGSSLLLAARSQRTVRGGLAFRW
ncbi:MAG: TonB-dependent receptor [Acidobacteria bacterium]|nr:TonB-dependent receptor [Acidobacteriota bacterium]